jgi:tRNA A-37 threonylcarbamoyl transferase component Bud32
MADEKTCPHCGKPVPPTALGDLCPECMLKAGLATQTEGPGKTGPHGTKVVPPLPRPEEIAPLFPQLEILQCLGRGGMGVVYKARQPRLNRLVALKILAREKEQDTQFADRFTREAQALARLSHPNIVTVYDFGETAGHCYLLMEFVDGLNLRQLLQAGKMPPEQALTIVPKICEALQYAHEQGIVHRDIKPENILLDKQGRVKIADFGIAKMLGAEAGQQTLTGAKDTVGTPHYMAPEQVEKPSTVDHRADIYSLGVVFYEMLTGELPLGKFQPPSKKVQIDVRLDEVVLHALEKEPERRYQQASQVKTAVEAIAATEKSSVRNQEREAGPRFSRTAMAGAVCLPISLLPIIWFVALVRQMTRTATPMTYDTSWVNILFGITGTMGLVLIGPLITSILGWIAVGQIRRSAGKLVGLELALFEGLFFPLLMLDAIIAGLWVFLDKLLAVYVRHLGGSMFVDLWDFSIWLLLLALMLVWIDSQIIRRVCRIVNGPSPRPMCNRPARFSHAWKFAAFVFVLILSYELSKTVFSHLIAGHFLSVKSDYIGQTWFPQGDSIEITSVERTENQMTVKGRYDLVSHDKAELALYVTVTNKNVAEGSGEIRPISRGSGDFTLVYLPLVPGLPHVSMYADGHPFASLYFGTKAEALKESKASWITNGPSVSTLKFRLVLPKDSAEPADDLPSASRNNRFHLSRQVLLDDTDIAQAGVDFSPDGRRKIEVRFTDTGAQKFEKITANNIGRQLAIVFHGQVLSAPVIQLIIPNGLCQVDGSMSADEMNEIVDCLNQATMPTAKAWNFSPVYERVLPFKPLPDASFGWLDLDSGTILTNSSLDWESRSGYEWIRTNGLDVVTTDSAKHFPTLLGVDMLVAPAPTNGWEIVTAADVVNNWALLQQEPQPKTVFGASPSQTDTFFFETREGGKGILQILGFADNPRGVKIRYKLVQNAGNALEVTNANRPKVIFVSPADGATNVDTRQEIHVRFDQPMNPADLWIQWLSGGFLPDGQPRYEPDRNEFIIPVQLMPGQTNELMINSKPGGMGGFRGANLTLAEEYRWHFTAKPLAAKPGAAKPGVVRIAPMPGETLPVLTLLKITFDQPMLPPDQSPPYLRRTGWSGWDLPTLIPSFDYDPTSHSFTLPVVLPPDNETRLTLEGFRSADDVAADPVIISCQVGTNNYSSEQLDDIASAAKDPRLEQLLSSMKAARARLTSGVETVQSLSLFGGKGVYDLQLMSHSATFKWQGTNQVYADISDIMNMKAFILGSDSTTCWLYSDDEHNGRRLDSAPTATVADIYTSIADPFALTKLTVKEAIAKGRLLYQGRTPLAGQDCHRVQSWMVRQSPNEPGGVLAGKMEWWIDAETLLPVQAVHDSQFGCETVRFHYDELNQPLPAAAFQPPVEPGAGVKSDDWYERKLEPDENRFLTIKDGGDGRMTGRFGVSGPSGTTSSGLN